MDQRDSRNHRKPLQLVTVQPSLCSQGNKEKRRESVTVGTYMDKEGNDEELLIALKTPSKSTELTLHWENVMVISIQLRPYRRFCERPRCESTTWRRDKVPR